MNLRRKRIEKTGKLKKRLTDRIMNAFIDTDTGINMAMAAGGQMNHRHN